MTTALTDRQFPVATPSTADLQVSRAALLHQVEEQLDSFLSGEIARWSIVDEQAAAPIQAIRMLTQAGGKRLRPLFCISGFLAAGGGATSQSIVDAGTAWELLHACALIHDDVMDESPLRRGLPTAHVRHAEEHQRNGWLGAPARYGESVALLAGDLALVYADRFMAAAGPQVRAIWDETRTELIVGQFLDCAIAVRGRPDTRLARWIARCKSGRYTIERPLTLGATLAGRTDLTAAFEEYGAALGEAFQLRDDLLDVVGDTAVVGKPTSLDVEGHKMTLLMSLAMERDEQVCAAVDAGRPPRELLLDSGACAAVEHHIGRLVERARDALDRAPLNGWWRREFSELAQRVAYRVK